MKRIELESLLGADRAGLLERCEALSEADLRRDATPSEQDADTMWSMNDHLIHLAGIEKNFNQMIRRHLDGSANPVGLTKNADGTRRPREEIMAAVHKGNEEWVAKHRSRSFSETVALGQQVRAETLALLAELSDDQLAEKLPGAPWADGTIGGVLGTNAAHGRMHWSWAKAGLAERS